MACPVGNDRQKNVSRTSNFSVLPDRLPRALIDNILRGSASGIEMAAGLSLFILPL